MDRLWALYGKYVEDVENSAGAARQAFGFQNPELLRVRHLTREEFEVCVVSDRGDPEVRTSWLRKILAFAESDEERRSLSSALDAQVRHSTLRRPHFAEKRRSRETT
jgi:hypothetical protein